MSRKGRGYQKSSYEKKNQTIQVSSVESGPTEENNKIKDDAVDDASIRAVEATRVPTENGKITKIKNLLLEWAAMLGGLAVFVMFVVYIVGIDFDLKEAKGDIYNHKLGLETNQKDIQEVRLSNAVIGKDIEYLKEGQAETKKKVMDVEAEIREIKHKNLEVKNEN